MDCSVAGGFYFAAGKALFGLCVLVAVLIPLAVALCISTHKENKRLAARRKEIGL